MHNQFIIFLTCLFFVLTACVENDNQSSNTNGSVIVKPELSEEESIQRQQQAFEKASKSPEQFKARLKENCPYYNSILLTTAETIQLGTRVYNAGGTSLTHRIYEGTIYKILFTIKDDCMELSDALQASLLKANNEDEYSNKAWALRDGLDLIMGGPPTKPPGE